ncbi:hypothetical protein BGX30_008113, partial [Mortierella sp. GBA39]
MEDFVRLDSHSPRSFNRYRTVESPVYVATSSPPGHLLASSSPEHPRSTSTEAQEVGHPALSRTRTPRKNHGRFSFKERTRKKVHDPPPKMKQFRQKPYKEPPTPPPPISPAAKKKPDAKKEKVPSISRTTTKQGLVRSMAWHHPTRTLEVGTLSANTKRVFSTAPTSTSPSPVSINPTPPTSTPLTSASATSTSSMSTAPTPTTPNSSQQILQQEVVKSVQEASRLAAGVKRTAQRLA